MQVSCGDLDQNRADINIITLLCTVWILLHLLSQNPVTGYSFVDIFIARLRALVFAYKNLAGKSEGKRSLVRFGRKVR